MKLTSSIALILCLLLSACGSSSVEPTLQRNLEQRAKNAAVQLIADPDTVFNQINTGSPTYVNPSNPENYVYIYDLDLNIVAHPNPNIRDTNHANKRDANNNPYPREIINRALGRKKGRSGWIEYNEGGRSRLAYFELAQARDGYYYVIVSTTPFGGSSMNQGPQSTRETRPPQEFTY